MCFTYVTCGCWRVCKNLEEGGSELWYHTSSKLFKEVFGNAAQVFERWHRWMAWGRHLHPVRIQLKLLGRLDSWNPATYWLTQGMALQPFIMFFMLECVCSDEPKFLHEWGKKKNKEKYNPKKAFQRLSFSIPYALEEENQFLGVKQRTFLPSYLHMFWLHGVFQFNDIKFICLVYRHVEPGDLTYLSMTHTHAHTHPSCCHYVSKQAPSGLCETQLFHPYPAQKSLSYLKSPDTITVRWKSFFSTSQESKICLFVFFLICSTCWITLNLNLREVDFYSPQKIPQRRSQKTLKREKHPQMITV